MARTMTSKVDGGSCYLDAMSLSVDGMESAADFDRKIADSFSNLSSSGLEFESMHGEAIVVRSRDCCVLPRLVLTSFTDLLKKK
eukprot:11415325-Heterocapsa_arctica.AAC.1